MTLHGTPRLPSTPMRVATVARYLFVDAARAQRALIPVVLYLVVLGILFAGDHTGAPGPWVASVLVLYPAAAWIALTVANNEDPAQRAVTTASAGGPGVVTGAILAVALAVDVVLALVPVAIPALISPGGFPPASLVAGGLAHVAAAVTGTAVGLVCARPVIARIGWSFTVTAAVVLITAVQPWLPPVGASARALSDPSAPVLLFNVALALLLVAAAAVTSWAVSRHL